MLAAGLLSGAHILPLLGKISFPVQHSLVACSSLFRVEALRFSYSMLTCLLVCPCPGIV